METDTTNPQPGQRRLSGDDGANLVEYSMLVALIVVVCLSAVTFFGNASTSKMSCASGAIVNAQNGQAAAATCASP